MRVRVEFYIDDNPPLYEDYEAESLDKVRAQLQLKEKGTHTIIKDDEICEINMRNIRYIRYYEPAW